jgi:hypothetical protein
MPTVVWPRPIRVATTNVLSRDRFPPFDFTLYVQIVESAIASSEARETAHNSRACTGRI